MIKLLCALFMYVFLIGCSLKPNEDVKRIESDIPKDKRGDAPSFDTIRYPRPLGYVSDFESLFSEKQILELDSLISTFEKRTSLEICVVTIDSAMTPFSEFDSFTLDLANYWGVGKSEVNNGILIAVSRVYKKIKIQNGLGIEKFLSDVQTKEIIDSGFIPSFKNGNYYQGSMDGLKLLMNHLDHKLNIN